MAWNNYLKDQKSSPYISMLEGYGKNYMNPNSSYNAGMFDKAMRSGREAAGQSYNQGMRMQAAGVNPFANQQYRASINGARDASYGQYQSGMAQNQQMGQSMLGMGMQARMQQAQMEQQQKQWDREYRQHERGQWMTLGGTLASGMIQPGGLLGKAIDPTTKISIDSDSGVTSDVLGDVVNGAVADAVPAAVSGITAETQGLLDRFVQEDRFNQWFGTRDPSGVGDRVIGGPVASIGFTEDGRIFNRALLNSNPAIAFAYNGDQQMRIPPEVLKQLKGNETFTLRPSTTDPNTLGWFVKSAPDALGNYTYRPITIQGSTANERVIFTTPAFSQWQFGPRGD